jgi:hypothetical protein
MRSKSIIRLSLFLSLFILLIPCLASGQQLSYVVESGTQGNFGYSVIHTADNNNGSGYYTSGTEIFDISGNLNGTLSGNDLTLSNSTLTLDDLSSTDVWSLVITGGSLNNALGSGSQYAGGTIDYELYDATSTLFDSGTFYIDPLHFGNSGSPANSFSANDLFLWGQNWVNGETRPADWNSSTAGHYALGIDLGSMTVTVVPEPVSSTLFLVGAVTLGFRRFRKKLRK